ncbi:hypothetical protein H4R21_006426 [Coemansia helicoidea]|uniref:Uncharacterized protein n=2 Tax=Coemansia TaxID=4863 RepID=A0ACC1KKG3_9FUNG|nr:hypothetical protein H4R21_006426 [Coemansia helicoidea]
MSSKDLFFVDGDQDAQAKELLKFIGELRGETQVDQFVEAAMATGSGSEAVLRESAGWLARAEEAQMEAAYNQLFAVVTTEGGSQALDAAAGGIAKDVAATAASGAAGLRVLNNLYSLATDGSRPAVFSGIVELAVRTKAMAALVPVVPRLAKMVGEWGAGAGAGALLALRKAFDEAQFGSEAYGAELAYLEAVGAGGERAAEVAGSAVVRFANINALCDVDALARLASVQELHRAGQLGAAGELLEQLLGSNYQQWQAYEQANAEKLAALGVDAAKAGDKMRLLTLASIASERLGEDVPFGDVAAAIGVDVEDVELWIIDVVRVGLVQGKMNQVTATLMPTRSTYRTFGDAQWKVLQTRLHQWKESLDALQPVIHSAKALAHQQTEQAAGQVHVAAKE